MGKGGERRRRGGVRRALVVACGAGKCRDPPKLTCSATTWASSRSCSSSTIMWTASWRARRSSASSSAWSSAPPGPPAPPPPCPPPAPPSPFPPLVWFSRRSVSCSIWRSRWGDERVVGGAPPAPPRDPDAAAGDRACAAAAAAAPAEKDDTPVDGRPPCGCARERGSCAKLWMPRPPRPRSSSRSRWLRSPTLSPTLLPSSSSVAAPPPPLDGKTPPGGGRDGPGPTGTRCAGATAFRPFSRSLSLMLLGAAAAGPGAGAAAAAAAAAAAEAASPAPTSSPPRPPPAPESPAWRSSFRNPFCSCWAAAAATSGMARMSSATVRCWEGAAAAAAAAGGADAPAPLRRTAPSSSESSRPDPVPTPRGCAGWATGGLPPAPDVGTRE
jgi:hypothetical protein